MYFDLSFCSFYHFSKLNSVECEQYKNESIIEPGWFQVCHLVSDFFSGQISGLSPERGCVSHPCSVLPFFFFTVCSPLKMDTLGHGDTVITWKKKLYTAGPKRKYNEDKNCLNVFYFIESDSPEACVSCLQWESV